MDAVKARAILTQAKQDQIYEGEVPDSDGRAIEEAEAIIAMAEEAWDQLVRGPEVAAILKLAAADIGGNGAKHEQDDEKPVPQPEQEAEVPEEKEPAPASDEPETSEAQAQAEESPDYDETLILSRKEPWDGYKDEKVAHIKTVIEGLHFKEPEAALHHIQVYETHNKNRPRVLSYVDAALEKLRPEAEETPEPAPEPQPEPAPEPEPVAEQAEEEPEPEPEPAPDPEPFFDPEKPEQQAPDDGYDDVIASIEEQLQRERLHIPEPPTEAAPELPWDWTRMTDAELQRFHGIFSAYAYRVSYLLAREDRIALHWKAAADELSQKLIVAADKYDEKGKEVKVTFLEAEIANDEHVQRHRRRQRKHEAFASAYRSERDSYMKLVEALSRQETLRHNEWERSGQKRR